MAKKKPTSKPDPDAITREEPAAKTVRIHFDGDAPGACKLGDAFHVFQPGDNDIAPATVELLRKHPHGEQCRDSDGKRLREPPPEAANG